MVLWDVATRKRLVDEPLTVKDGFLGSLAFSPDSKTIAAGYTVLGTGVTRGGVVLWDVSAGKRLVDEPAAVQDGYIRSVAFSPDGKSIAVGYDVVGAGVAKVGASFCGT